MRDEAQLVFNGGRNQGFPLPVRQTHFLNSKLLVFFLFLSLTAFEWSYAGKRPREADAGPSAVSEALSYLSDDVGYREILTLLAEKTKVSREKIDLDFRKWVQQNSDGITEHTLVSFLSHIYSVQKLVPQSDWAVEFDHLKILVQTHFIFDASTIYRRLDPQEILVDEFGNWFASYEVVKKWEGSYKTVYRVMILDDPTGKEYALVRVRKPKVLRSDEKTKGARERYFRAKEAYKVARYESGVIRAIQKAIQTDGEKPRGILTFDQVLSSEAENRILLLAPFFNLNDAHRKSFREPMSPEDQVSAAHDLLEGLSFLHRHRIAHRDIKPANVLLHDSGSELHAALADFGTAYQEGQEGLDKQLNAEDYLVTTHQYLAPEAVEKFFLRALLDDPARLSDRWGKLKEHLGIRADLQLKWRPAWTTLQTDQASDNWSLGASLLEIMSGLQLNAKKWVDGGEGEPKPEAFLGVEQSKVDAVLLQLEAPEFKWRVAPNLIPVVKCLLRVDPEARCSSQSALELLRSMESAALLWPIRSCAVARVDGFFALVS